MILTAPYRVSPIGAFHRTFGPADFAETSTKTQSRRPANLIAKSCFYRATVDLVRVCLQVRHVSVQIVHFGSSGYQHTAAYGYPSGTVEEYFHPRTRSAHLTRLPSVRHERFGAGTGRCGQPDYGI